jgi:hypothetical protein
VIDVLRRCLLTQTGEPRPGGPSFAVAFKCLALDQHCQAILEAEIGSVGMTSLLLERLGHASQAEFAQAVRSGVGQREASSMIVAAAADVLVLDGRLIGHGFRAVSPVEAVA